MRAVIDRSIFTSLTLPASTTYRILGMVMDVSATFVATTHRRAPGGGGWKTRN
jgi:hypothetical protein